jgi:2Fe-2S ferredoxin
MGIVNLIDREGKQHALQALDGWRIMEVLRDWGMFVPPRCGGAGECGMCHVKVAAEWSDRLPPVEEQEAKLLPLIPTRDETSRLSCQLLWREDLDGITVTLA